MLTSSHHERTKGMRGRWVAGQGLYSILSGSSPILLDLRVFRSPERLHHWSKAGGSENTRVFRMKSVEISCVQSLARNYRHGRILQVHYG